MNNSQNKPTITVQGDIAKIGDIEFIMFPEVNGGIPILTRDVAFYSPLSDDLDSPGNRSTELLQKLDEFLQKIVSAVGDKNVLKFETDENTLNKLNIHNFYLTNKEIFDKRFDKYSILPLLDAPTDDSTQKIVYILSDTDKRRYEHGCAFVIFGIRPFLYLNKEVFYRQGETSNGNT